MDHAGAAFGGDVVGQVHRREAVVERVLRVQRVLEGDAAQRFAEAGGNDLAFELVALQAGFDQVGGQDQQQRLAVA